jgi:hypothetical protein
VGYGLGLTVGAGAANNLLFLSQPTNTNHGISQNPAVTVQVRDAYNNVRVQDNSTNVNLTLGPNPYSATLSGTLTRTSVGGIASFNDISINKVGNHYTLLANSAGLTGDTSSQFNIENFGIITWVGDVSTNWDDPENWVGGVPTISSIVTIQSTLNQPIFNTHTRLEALTLELGSHLTTLGYDLSLSQNLTLQGTLIVSNSTITAKLVQGSSTGLISGSTPTISSTEVIGLLDAPINFNTTGPATLYAGSMKDLTSISVAGTGSYRMAGSISGFAFINGRLQPYIGQESFRNLLNQASLSQIRLGGFTSMFKLFSPLKNKSFKINPVNISFKTPVEQTKEWKTTKVVDQTKKQESFKVEPNGNIGSSENSRLLSKPQMLNPLPMVNQK